MKNNGVIDGKWSIWKWPEVERASFHMIWWPIQHSPFSTKRHTVAHWNQTKKNPETGLQHTVTGTCTKAPIMLYWPPRNPVKLITHALTKSEHTYTYAQTHTPSVLKAIAESWRELLLLHGNPLLLLISPMVLLQANQQQLRGPGLLIPVHQRSTEQSTERHQAWQPS